LLGGIGFLEESLDTKLFEKLVTTPGISGREERIRDAVKDELAASVDDVRVDRLGNVIGVRKGSEPRVMLSAHMDTIGFLVSQIDDDGFLRISPIGGFDARTLVMRRVLVQAKEDLVGLVSPMTKPIHLLTEEERKKSPKIEELFVDLMLPADRVKELVSIGDPVSLYREPLLTDRAVTTPYLDDRLGVYVMLDALRKAKDTSAEICAVVSVQEEVGLRGARTGAFEVDPDIGIAIDVTLAADMPGMDKGNQALKLGAGAAIGVMNASSIADPRLVDRFKELAEEHAISYQMDILPFGGTDAGAIQLTRSGVPAITISIPIRYVHTVNEMALVDDIEATGDLVARFLGVVHELDLAW
jgi:putative aminopeptidase FrvX